MKLHCSLAIALVVLTGTAPAWAAPTASAPVVNWPAERELQNTVTLESARLPLGELVAAVAAQTKIKLNLPAELGKRLLVMRAEALPLAALLPVLGQLYGLEWTRDAAPNSFSARVVATPVELALLGQGDLNQLRDRVRVEATQCEQSALRVARGWDAARLAEGVPLGELPGGLGDALKNAKQERAALNYLSDWSQWTPFALRSMRVRVALPRATKEGAQPAPHFILIDDQGLPRRDLGIMEMPGEK